MLFISLPIPLGKLFNRAMHKILFNMKNPVGFTTTPGFFYAYYLE